MIHVCLLAVCFVGQVATTADTLPAKVADLVRQLDAPEKATRDTAERALLDLGTEAFELLPDVNSAMSAEVRMRLTRVRAQLERRRAESTARGSTITLKGEGLPLAEVLDSVSKQTGNEIVDYRARFGEEVRDTKFTLSLDKAPFWTAFDAILDQAGLTIYNFGGANHLALISRPNAQVPRSGNANYVGAFRIAATDMVAHVGIREPGRRTLQVNVDVAWEPRVRPIIMTLDGGRLSAKDDRGQALTLDAAGHRVELDIPADSTAVEVPIHLKLPTRDAKKIATLSGVFDVVLPGRVEDLRFNQLGTARKVSQRRGGVAVTLDEVRKNQSLFEVRIRVAFADAGQALESHRGWVFNNEAYLETAQGEKLEMSGMETTSQSEREVGIAYLFDVPGGLEGCTFVYRTPAAILKSPIAFELRDLELP